MRHTRSFAAAATLLVLAAAACSDNTAPLPAALTQAQADSVGAVVAADLDALPEGAVYAGGIPFPTPPLGSANPTVCQPVISPFPPTNSDGDLVPDSVRIDFTGCVITRPMETITRFGTIDIIDPQPTVTGHHIRSVFTALGKTVTRTQGGATFTLLMNGERAASATSSVLQHTITNFLTEFTFPDNSTASHLKDWAAAFTADVPGTISLAGLPAGTWVVNGSSTWTKDQRSWSMQITTTTPLHFDPACQETPRFDAGSVTTVVTRNGEQSTVTVEFTACGQYTVTRS